MPHLAADLLRLIFEGHLPPRTFARALLSHLDEVCRPCTRELRAAAPRLAEAAAAEGATAAAAQDPVAQDPAAQGPEALASEARRLRLARRWAREDLLRLLATPAERRGALVRRAHKRFRSRATVELVVEHGRELTRSDPTAAAELLAFVPELLLWLPGGLEASWGRDLAVRAEARRANALRVAGDLPAAERLFGELRRRLATRPAADATLYAEVGSLEASLRRDQRRYEEAGALLDRAVLVYQEAGEHEGLARVLIKRAEIAQHFTRHEDALADLTRARQLVDPKEQGFLYLCTVVAAIHTLLDLGRHAEAEWSLLQTEEEFPAAIEPWWRLRFRYLQGRAAHGQGHHERAVGLLAEARRGFVEQKQPYDAAAATLDLALVHLDRGDLARARRLAQQVAPVFRAVGVEREALATLRVLQQASAEEARRHLAALHTHLAAAQGTPRRRDGDFGR